MRTIFALAAIMLMAVGTGCNRQNLNAGCSGGCETGACDSGACRPSLLGGLRLGKGGGLGLHQRGNQYVSPGPATAQTAYPYYTVKGPRDFLCNNPNDLGPR